MTTHQIIKSKFSQPNDKRFYFPNAIISLPIGHSALKELDKFKKNKGQRIENYFLTEKEHLVKLEKKALIKWSRRDFSNNILVQSFKVVNNNNFNRYLYNPTGETVLNFILNARWKKNSENIPTMESSKGIFS